MQRLLSSNNRTISHLRITGRKCLLGILVWGLFAVSSAAHTQGGFFEGIDASLESGPTSSVRRLTVERYYRLMARISVFALYCDPGNRQGYSTRFSRIWQASDRMQSEAARVLGGQVAAYDLFEGLRNEESLRMARADVPTVCASDNETFANWVSLSAAQIENHCRVTARGEM